MASSRDRTPLEERLRIDVDGIRKNDNARNSAFVGLKQKVGPVQRAVKPADIVEVKFLAAGGFGFVFLVTDARGELMVRKTVHIMEDTSTLVMREIENLHKCDNPYIVKLYDWFQDGPKVDIFMEYMNGGSLDIVCQQLKAMPEKFVGHVVGSLLSALNYLTNLKLIHGDVAPGNTLVNSNGDVKLGGFGCSRFAESIDYPAETYIGTVDYMSPDQHYHGNTRNGDQQWALAITAIELAIGEHPTKRECEGSPIRYYIRYQSSEPIYDGSKYNLSHLFTEFVSLLMRRRNNPLSFESLLKDPFVIASIGSQPEFRRWLSKLFSDEISSLDLFFDDSRATLPKRIKTTSNADSSVSKLMIEAFRLAVTNVVKYNSDLAEVQISLGRVQTTRARANILNAPLSDRGDTALHLAVLHQKKYLAEFLLDQGAEVNTRNLADRLPIHEAAKSGDYDLFYVLADAAIRKSCTDVSSPDHRFDSLTNWTLALNFACEGGNVSIVQWIINNCTLRLTASAKQPNFLTIAIKAKQERVVRYIVGESPIWREALRNPIINSIGEHDSTMHWLIREMPEVAFMVLDRCTEEVSKNVVRYNYEFCDDTFCLEFVTSTTIWNGKRPELSVYGQPYTDGPSKEKLLEGPRSYCKSVLSLMVERDQSELLAHPLTRTLIQQKWSKFGCVIYRAPIIFHILYIAALTTYWFLLQNKLLSGFEEALTGARWLPSMFGCLLVLVLHGVIFPYLSWVPKLSVFWYFYGTAVVLFFQWEDGSLTKFGLYSAGKWNLLELYVFLACAQLVLLLENVRGIGWYIYVFRKYAERTFQGRAKLLLAAFTALLGSATHVFATARTIVMKACLRVFEWCGLDSLDHLCGHNTEHFNLRFFELAVSVLLLTVPVFCVMALTYDVSMNLVSRSTYALMTKQQFEFDQFKAKIMSISRSEAILRFVSNKLILFPFFKNVVHTKQFSVYDRNGKLLEAYDNVKIPVFSDQSNYGFARDFESGYFSRWFRKIVIRRWSKQPERTQAPEMTAIKKKRYGCLLLEKDLGVPDSKRADANISAN